MPFVIATVVAALLTPLVIRAAAKVGLVDRPGTLKVHERPTPLGGIAVATAALVSVVVSSASGAPWVASALVIALATGLLDDRRSIRPTTRLLLQGAAAAALVAGIPEITSLGPPAIVGAVVVTLATINAVNMVDGQDGLATGLVVIAAAGLAIILGGGSAAVVPLAAAGAAVGFLPWNLPPARAFLGDGGAYVFGILLAAGALEASSAGWPDLLAAGACLGVFAYELLSTVLRRVGHRVPTHAGDRAHSYDLLASTLGSRAKATYVCWAVGGASALIGLAVQTMRPVVGGIVIAGATAVAAAIHVRLRPPMEVPR